MKSNGKGPKWKPNGKPNGQGSINRLRELLQDCDCSTKHFFEVAGKKFGVPEGFRIEDEVGRFELVAIRGVVSVQNFKLGAHVLMLAERLYRIERKDRSNHFNQLAMAHPR